MCFNVYDIWCGSIVASSISPLPVICLPTYLILPPSYHRHSCCCSLNALLCFKKCTSMFSIKISIAFEVLFFFSFYCQSDHSNAEGRQWCFSLYYYYSKSINSCFPPHLNLRLSELLMLIFYILHLLDTKNLNVLISVLMDGTRKVKLDLSILFSHQLSIINSSTFLDSFRKISFSSKAAHSQQLNCCCFCLFLWKAITSR